jgi:hypothetical protein
MKHIYIDSEFKCHTVNDGTMTEIQHEFFNNKCDTFIEGYCYEPDNEKIYPWKPYSELDAAQREYERHLLAEYEAALAASIPISDLDAAYQEGVNSV